MIKIILILLILLALIYLIVTISKRNSLKKYKKNFLDKMDDTLNNSECDILELYEEYTKLIKDSNNYYDIESFYKNFNLFAKYKIVDLNIHNHKLTHRPNGTNVIGEAFLIVPSVGMSSDGVKRYQVISKKGNYYEYDSINYTLEQVEAHYTFRDNVTLGDLYVDRNKELCVIELLEDEYQFFNGGEYAVLYETDDAIVIIDNKDRLGRVYIRNKNTLEYKYIYTKYNLDFIGNL